MPRMTNTFMLGGSDDPGEILSRAKKGIFAKSFGGGQVDITSGKFVFSCTEAYMIENGLLGAPIKGATLIGDGPEVLKKRSEEHTSELQSLIRISFAVFCFKNNTLNISLSDDLYNTHLISHT